MTPEVLENGASVLGIVAVVVGVLVWAIRKIVDMIQVQMQAQAAAIGDLGKRLVEEVNELGGGLGGVRSDLTAISHSMQQIADRMEAIAISQGDVTPPPRIPRIRSQDR